MRTKNFLIFVCSVIVVSLFLIIFGQHKPETIQSIVTSTNIQFQNFKDNLRDAESKKLIADEKYLELLNFNDHPRLYPGDVWKNTSLPVIVTYVAEGQHSQAIGLINNIGKLLPNNTILVYNVGLDEYSQRTLANYCNSTRCQIVPFDLGQFPSHVDDYNTKAYRPLVIQDALSRTGAIFFLEPQYRLLKNITGPMLMQLYEKHAKKHDILAWPMKLKNPVSSLTHKKMFEYFRTDADNFLFLQMVYANFLMVLNTPSMHSDIMLPWVQCALTADCIVPIGAQSAGCKFDKKPLYRYSGCHSYDTSALNIALGLRFKLDDSKYTFGDPDDYFRAVPLHRANAILKQLEQNTTTDGRVPLVSET